MQNKRTIEMDDDSDEEIVVRKVSRRQQLSDNDEEVEERPAHLKRLVKKDALESSKRPTNSPTRNQFVADQADEEDEEGELIQYSGSEEESDEKEYDLDDLETGSDIGSVNQDAIRQLHQKFEKDAENKGYNRLTRRRQGANRILGDDDEGHQLARRQRNRFAAQPKHDEALDLGVDNAAREEHLTADFIPTGVNKLNHLFLRIPRSKTAREKLSMHSELTAAQVAQAWDDPNPQMSFFRVSTSKTSSTIVPKKPIVNNFINRAALQHNLLNRSSSSSSRSGASTPTKTMLPGFQNPLPTFLKGHPSSSMTIADPVERAAQVSQLKRQLDTKVPEGLITKLSTTNARRFGYGNFKIYGKRSEFPDLFPDAKKKPESTVYKTPRY
ncbi:hypothetical protein DSO57_1003792 [Entomophthora muscae]|uniref:Uncharacterized protein n=1 Tax=Entomophthora muscae TaxID=34485 RepID=A0ACC2UH89_9FUNG|nr:hypothetical protein DSO57_1003792 [Entomophthora muscae]